MARWAGLGHKREAVSSDPQRSSRKPGAAAHIYKASTGEAETGRPLELLLQPVQLSRCAPSSVKDHVSKAM